MAISSVVYHELHYGGLRSFAPETNLAKLSYFLTELMASTFHRGGWRVGRTIRAELAQRAK